MITPLVLGLALLGAADDAAPPDPVTVQTQLCFRGPAAGRLAACEKALRMPTGSATHAHLLVAEALWQEQECAGYGLPGLRMAVDSEPDDITARLVLGWYLDRAKRPRDADEEYRGVARLAEGSTENFDLDASVLGVLKQSQQELGRFFLVLAQGFDRIGQPRIAGALYSATILNWPDKEDFANLSTFYERALKLTPGNASLYIAYADLLRSHAGGLPPRSEASLKLLQTAADSLERAVQISPEDSVYRYELGQAWLEIGNLSKGIQEMQHALKLRPDYPAAEHALRLAVAAQGGPALATQAAARPDTPAALERLHECIRKIGSRGQIACRDALKIGLTARNAAKAHLYLADGLAGPRAAAEYLEAQKADPAYALPFFRFALHGTSGESREVHDDVITGFHKAEQLRPDWTAAYELRALQLQKDGRTEEAIAEMQKALALDPEDEVLQEDLRTMQSGTGAQAWARSPSRSRRAVSFELRDSGSRKPAASNGLLLVLGESSWWMVRDGSSFRLHGPADEAVVPTKQGWWKIGIAKPPVQQAAEANQPISSFEQLWAVPLAASAPEYAPQEAPCAGGEGLEIRTYRLDWLTPEHAGITLRYQTRCAGSQATVGVNSYVLPVEALRRHADSPEGLKLPDLAGEGAWAAMQEGAEIEKLRLAAGLSAAHDATLTIDPDRWTLKRTRGRWALERPAELEQSSDGSPVASGGFDIPLEPPAKLVSQPELAPGWDVVLETVPDAVDAFSSPAQDWIVVLTPSRLLGFEVAKGSIGKRLFRQSLGDYAGQPVLLVQWASGTTVTKWNEALAPAFRSQTPR